MTQPRPDRVNTAPLVLTPSHERLLAALNRYGTLTAAQATRAVYDSRSLTRVQALLKGLADAGYAQPLTFGRMGPHGSTPRVYALDRRGRQYLMETGASVPARLRQGDEAGRSATLLAHRLLTIDLEIALAQLARRVPAVTISRVMGERALRVLPTAVTLPDGTTTAVIPDCYADLRVRTPAGLERQCVAFEADNGTEYQRAWRAKCAALLAFERGPYRAAFGSPFLTVAVVAPDAARRDLLRHWTAAELHGSNTMVQADLFRFAALPPDWEEIEGFFLGERWYRIGDDAPVPLIEGVAATHRPRPSSR